jgi:hypothetical protein
MSRLRTFALQILIAASSGACLAAAAAAPAPPAGMQHGPASAPARAAQGLPQVCLDVQTSDPLTGQFAARLKKTIAASGALRLASASGSCDLSLHVPGNLLRFETAAGVMVGTVVIVTSPSDRYLSTSIAACQARKLEPCAVRAVAAAKLAVLMSGNGGS